MTQAILLIAHGSRHAPANDDLHHVAAQLRGRGHAIVVASFLELAEPGIDEGGRAVSPGRPPGTPRLVDRSGRAADCRGGITKWTGPDPHRRPGPVKTLKEARTGR